MAKYLLVLVVIVFVIAGTANADFYKWEDEDGTVHITDYPPPATGNKIDVLKDESNTKAQPGDEEQQESTKDGQNKESKENKAAEVVLYTKNSCTDCDKAREFLKAKRINFTEYNIDNDKQALKKRKDIDDSDDVPFAIINRSQVYGFSEAVYNRTLKLKP
jgi:glutaredoxin